MSQFKLNTLRRTFDKMKADEELFKERNQKILQSIADTGNRLHSAHISGSVHEETLKKHKLAYMHFLVSSHPAWKLDREKRNSHKVKKIDKELQNIHTRRQDKQTQFEQELEQRKTLQQKVCSFHCLFQN